MISMAHAYLLVFGLLTVAFGILGFVKANSRASLVAGGVSGLLLLVAAYLVGSVHAVAGLVLGAVVSSLLTGRFGRALATKRVLFPAAPMVVLGLGGMVTTLAALFVPG